jgi:hypothetical protein
MRDIGFSTGALALGDFRRGLALLDGRGCSVVELSALRETELPELMRAIFALDLGHYSHVSVHAPSRLRAMKESAVATLLSPCIERGWPVILHPDAIGDHGCWRDFGAVVCIENMDKRKPSGRTADELAEHFAALPDASLCLDLGHARQVDPTFGIARRILKEYGEKLVQLHLSELDAKCHHEPLSMATVWAVREIARLIPPAPVILESVVREDQIAKELQMAAACFETAPIKSAAYPIADGTTGTIAGS